MNKRTRPNIARIIRLI